MVFSGNLETATDFFKKLQEEANELNKRVTSRNLINFAMTAYHLIEWIKNGKYSAKVRTEVHTLAKTNIYLKACKDIANGSKHFIITKYKTEVRSVDSAQGFGVGRFGCGPFGVGEESIKIELKNKTSWNVIEFKDLVMNTWEWIRFYPRVPHVEAVFST